MKRTILWIMLQSIFLIIFNVLFFVIGGTEHVASVWMSWVFIHFAYLMVLVTPALMGKNKSSHVFGFALYSISATYFFLQFIIGMFFILVGFQTIGAALLVQLILAGLYGIILIIHLLANEHIAEAEEKRKHELAYVKTASAKLKILLSRISDKDAKWQIERAYDAISTSPSKSHPSVAQMENDILQSLNELEAKIAAEDNESIISAAKSLLAAANERNLQLRSLN